MTSIELLFLFTLVGLIWFWFNGLTAREMAIKTGAGLCQKRGVYFLDDSVAQIKLRLQRNSSGHVVFYREYSFEFTSDGAYRYKGKICLMGKYVVSTQMEAYREIN